MLAIRGLRAFHSRFLSLDGERAMIDDLEPRPVGGQALRDLTREDLDGYAVEDLEARAATLRAEILRTEAAVVTKRQKKSAADALFSFGSRDT